MYSLVRSLAGVRGCSVVNPAPWLGRSVGSVCPRKAQVGVTAAGLMRSSRTARAASLRALATSSWRSDFPPMDPLRLELDRPLICFDLETTHVDSRARVVQIGAIKVSPDGRQEVLDILVNPGMPQSAYSAAHRIHGKGDEALGDKPLFGEVAQRVWDFFCREECDILGFNSNQFDIPKLRAEFQRWNPALAFPQSGTRCIDVMKIIRRATKSMKGRLEDALRKYAGLESNHKHEATHDADATLRVLSGVLAEHPEVPRDVQGLHDYSLTLAQQKAQKAQTARDPDDAKPKGLQMLLPLPQRMAGNAPHQGQTKLADIPCKPNAEPLRGVHGPLTEGSVELMINRRAKNLISGDCLETMVYVAGIHIGKKVMEVAKDFERYLFWTFGKKNGTAIINYLRSHYPCGNPA